jgi:hypothetical protein
LGSAERDAASPTLRQPLLPDWSVRRKLGDKHLFGRNVVTVEITYQVGDQLGIRHILDSIDDSSESPNHPSPSDVKNLKRRLELVAEQGEQVEVLPAVGNHLLAFQCSLNVA